jgi:hypothetical protein
MPQFTMIPGSQKNDESRVIELADGRVLFLARGRFYYIRDYPHGHSLEARLKWVEHAVAVCFFAILLGAWWANNWWWMLLALPALLLPILAERLVVSGCGEATDPMARAEAAARSSQVELGPAFLHPSLIAVTLFGLEFFRGKVTTFRIIELALVLSVMSVAFAELWRKRRAEREAEILGGPRSPDNKPIVPR